MSVSSDPAAPDPRLSDIRHKYSFAGRLERYCAGRLRILPIRFAYEVSGSILAAAFGGWFVGLIALFSCLAGEALETATVIWARQGNRIAARPRRVGRIVTLGSAAWATGVSGGAAALWSIGGTAFWFLGFVFLVSALMNAHLVGGLHRPSLRVKQIILGGMAAALVADAYRTLGAQSGVAAFGIGALIMGFTLWGLFHRLEAQNRKRHEAEQRLIEAQLELEASNDELQNSKEELRRAVQKAETLAFDSQAATRAKANFLTTMSREIRAPMNAIIDSAGEVLDAGLPKDQAARVGSIRRGAQSLLTIVSDILDLSDAEAGKLEIRKQTFALDRIWGDLIDFADRIAEEKGIEFVVDGDMSIGIDVMGDEPRMRQVMMNLLTNAIRATENGTVTLSLTTKQVDQELSLVMAVSDQGPGIPRNNLARLFNGLGDGEGGASGTGGAGLGLSVSRRLARLMGGDLRARSQIGQGSTFTFMLPLELAAKVPARDARPEAQAPDLSNKRILVVDDSPDSARMLTRIMEPTGAALNFSRSADPLLDSVRTLAPDVILLDVVPTRDTALASTAAIRAAETQTGDARRPILALTPSALAEDRRRYREAGIDALIVRPVTRAGLYAALQPFANAARA